MFMCVCVHTCLIHAIECVYSQRRCSCLVRMGARVCMCLAHVHCITCMCLCMLAFGRAGVCFPNSVDACMVHVCMQMCVRVLCGHVSGVCVYEHTSVGACPKDPLENATQCSAGAGLAFMGRRGRSRLLANGS